jgi:hypothetical protein
MPRVGASIQMVSRYSPTSKSDSACAVVYCGASAAPRAADRSNPRPPPARRMDSAAVAIVTVSFPAQGHLNQLLHMSLLLTSRWLPVHFAAPELHLREVRTCLHGWGPDAAVVYFHALDVPAHDSPFPEHMQPLFEAPVPGAHAAPVRGLLHRRAGLASRAGEEAEEIERRGGKRRPAGARLGFLASGRDAACVMAVRDRTSGSNG